MNLVNRDLVTIDDLTNGEIESIFSLADEMSAAMPQQYGICNGKVMATIFFEPSTRTRLSFEAAMHRLGGSVITAVISALPASRSGWIPIFRSQKRPLTRNSSNSKRTACRRIRFRCAIIFRFRKLIGTIRAKRCTAGRPGRSTARTDPGSTWASGPGGATNLSIVRPYLTKDIRGGGSTTTAKPYFAKGTCMP